MPKDPRSMSTDEKRQELRAIKKEINPLYHQIEDNKKRARKLLFDAILHAKRIGDLLGRAKELLPWGKYQPWVKKNFDGSPQRARRYKWLAAPAQWKRIAARLNDKEPSSKSIRWAEGILDEERLDFKPPATRHKDAVKRLTKQFENEAVSWPEKATVRLANDSTGEFMELTREAAQKRYRQMRRLERKEKDDN